MIIPAELKHVPFIAKLLVREYKNLNKSCWYNYYKTDFDLFARIVEARIREEKGEFKYFIYNNQNAQPLGFASLLQKKRGEVLMLVFDGESKKENYSDLLKFAIAYLRENGSESIVFEAAPSELEYKSILDDLWAIHFSSKFIM